MPEPVCELGLAQLGEVVDALLAEIDATDLDVLCGGLAHALDDDGGVGFEDDAIVNDLINGEGDEVVVFDDGALVNGLPGMLVSISPTQKSLAEPRLEERT